MTQEQLVFALVANASDGHTARLRGPAVIHGQQHLVEVALSEGRLEMRIDGLPSTMTGNTTDLARYVVSLFGASTLDGVVTMPAIRLRGIDGGGEK